MAKRLTDTNKYKKPFIRSLPGPYKIFWDYLYLDCDHAGIWIVDFEIAQLYIGKDMPICREDALKYFNNGEKRIIEIDNGSKWFISPFIDFQYGELNEANRAHNSVMQILKKYSLLKKKNKPLISPLQGDKDKDMVKDMDIIEGFGEIFLRWLHYKRHRGESYKDKDSCFLAYKKLLKLSEGNSNNAEKIIEQSLANNWAGLFELKEKPKVEISPSTYVMKGKPITDKTI